MGYVVQTDTGSYDLYENAVAAYTQDPTSGNSSSFLYLKDENDNVIAIYHPFKWIKAGVSTALLSKLDV